MTGIERSDILSRGSHEPQRQKILIVDDAKTNLMILSSLLAEEGDIICATDGVQAIALAESDLPDLILLDVSMPGMDGYEVCRRLKSNIRTRDIPVVFVTGRTEDNDQEKGLLLGAIDYILKPYSPLIVLARIRNHLALQKAHLDLKIANAELTRLAATDFLTGVLNRRRFMELGEAEVARVRRSGRCFGTVMIDVDHFKTVNDTYGHDVGDTVLRTLAEACVDRLRNVDIVGRMGGEEFALILPETDPQGAKLTVERLREYLGELTVPVDTGTLKVTVSAGVTTVQDPNDSIEAALKRADEALYEAKGRGRNTTVVREEM